MKDQIQIDFLEFEYKSYGSSEGKSIRYRNQLTT